MRAGMKTGCGNGFPHPVFASFRLAASVRVFRHGFGAEPVLAQFEVQGRPLHAENLFGAFFATDAASRFVQDVLNIPLLQFLKRGGVRIEGGFRRFAGAVFWFSG